MDVFQQNVANQITSFALKPVDANAVCFASAAVTHKPLQNYWCVTLTACWIYIWEICKGLVSPLVYSDHLVIVHLLHVREWIAISMLFQWFWNIMWSDAVFHHLWSDAVFLCLDSTSVIYWGVCVCAMFGCLCYDIFSPVFALVLSCVSDGPCLFVTVTGSCLMEHCLMFFLVVLLLSSL